jgi:hypothetical protein
VNGGIDLYRRYLGARYSTFRCAFDLFVAMRGRTIVELGTTRSFVSGGAAKRDWLCKISAGAARVAASRSAAPSGQRSTISHGQPMRW